MEHNGDKCLAQMLQDELGDGPMYDSDWNVLTALSKLYQEAEQLLTAENKEEFVNRARVIAKNYPHDFENFAYNVDCLDENLPPASYIYISAAWMDISSHEQVIQFHREKAAEYEKECERFKNEKSSKFI